MPALGCLQVKLAYCMSGGVGAAVGYLHAFRHPGA